MKLKDFFISLAANKQKVEFYHRELGGRWGYVEGFRINTIDSYDVEKNCEICYDINFALLGAFQSSNILDSIIDSGEGNTSFEIFSDLSCVKRADYFDSQFKTQDYWIESEDTIFYFNVNELPLNGITIKQVEDKFEIEEEKDLKKVLSKTEYLEFYSFYKELLDGFQEIYVELEIENDYHDELYCSITEIYGCYEESVKFTLLDNSTEEYSKKHLKDMLIDCFKLEASLVEKILKIEQN
jgi:hypothetical protein